MPDTPNKKGTESLGKAGGERRQFLRKAAYTTPSLVLLGSLDALAQAPCPSPNPNDCPPSLIPGPGATQSSSPQR